MSKARQRFRERQRYNRIVGQLNELHAEGYTTEDIRAAGKNAYRVLKGGQQTPARQQQPTAPAPTWYQPPSTPQPTAPATQQLSTQQAAAPGDYDPSYSKEPWYVKYPMRITDTAFALPVGALTWLAGAMGGEVTKSPTLKQIWNIK